MSGTTVTRDHFHPAYQRDLDEEEVMRDRRNPVRAEDVQVRELPKRDRIATYPNPDGPSFVSTGEVKAYPYGEDPLDPTAQVVPRSEAPGMIGRLHPRPLRARS